MCKSENIFWEKQSQKSPYLDNEFLQVTAGMGYSKNVYFGVVVAVLQSSGW
jgi:hypothetical protein